MQVQNLELSVLEPQASGAPAIASGRLAALSGVKASLTIVAGRSSSTVGAVLSLKEGEVLPLDSALNAPFDVMLGTTLIARGELVAVGDQFGVRITQIQEPQRA